MAQHFTEYDGGNGRVVAGPGTGKTTRLVGHVRDLIDSAADPDRILVLTFSRATAADLRERLDEELPDYQERPKASTLHSHCFRELRRLTGSAFVGEVTADEWEARQLICEDLGERLGITGAAANELLIEYEAAWRTVGPPPTAAEAATFETQLEQLRLVFDFALLGEPVYKFKQFLDGAPDYIPEIDHLLVDEYQDLNPCDLYVIRELAHRSQGNIVVFGDDDQCIYAFRQADPGGLARFPTEHYDVGEYELDVCHRCPSAIFKPAQRLIEHNPYRLGKSIRPEHDGGTLEAHAVASEKQEHEAVVRLISQHRDDGVPLGEMLVLVPRRNLAEHYTHALLSNGIDAVNLAAPESAMNELAVRRLVCALRLSHSPNDFLALRGWLRCSHGVGVKKIAGLIEATGKKTGSS